MRSMTEGVNHELNMHKSHIGNAPIVTIVLSLPIGEVAADRLTVGVNHELNMCKRHNGNPPIVTITQRLPFRGSCRRSRLRG